MWLLSSSCSCQVLVVKQVRWVMLWGPRIPCTSRGGGRGGGKGCRMKPRMPCFVCASEKQ